MSWRSKRDEADLVEALSWLNDIHAISEPEAHAIRMALDPHEKLREVATVRFQPTVIAYMRVAAAITGVTLGEWIRNACKHRLITEAELRATRERPAPRPGGDAAP